MKNNTLIITAFYPPIIGGLEGYWQEVARRWKNNNCIILTNPSNNPEQDQREYFKIIRLPLFPWTWFKPSWLPLFWEIGSIIKKDNVSRIIFGHYANYVILGPILKRIYGITYDIMTHGIDTMIPQRRLLTGWCLKRCLLSAKNIYANSTITSNVLKKLVGDKKEVNIAYPGIDFDKYPDVDKDKLRNNLGISNKFIMLSMTRLVPIKGIDLVIKSLAKIKQTDIVYLVAGQGPELIPLKQLVEQNKLNNQVKFIGLVENIPEKKAKWYTLADMYIQTNRPVHDHRESFGMVFLEAARYELPVIASNNTGAVDIIEHQKTGLLINPDNIDDIANSIMEIKNNRQKFKEMGRKLKNNVEMKYSWKNTLKILNDV